MFLQVVNRPRPPFRQHPLGPSLYLDGTQPALVNSVVTWTPFTAGGHQPATLLWVGTVDVGGSTGMGLHGHYTTPFAYPFMYIGHNGSTNNLFLALRGGAATPSLTMSVPAVLRRTYAVAATTRGLTDHEIVVYDLTAGGFGAATSVTDCGAATANSGGQLLGAGPDSQGTSLFFHNGSTLMAAFWQRGFATDELYSLCLSWQTLAVPQRPNSRLAPAPPPSLLRRRPVFIMG